MQITGDQSKTLYSERYQQTYHSKHGAVNESLQVFVRGSTVATRLARQQATRVLEIGFGLGLNFVLTADLAIEHGCQLEYIAVEHAPISASQFAKLDYQHWLQNNEPIATVHSVLRRDSQQSPLPNNGYLELHVEDAVSPDLHVRLADAPSFDAIYLDAFSPDVNPECWTQPFFSLLNHLLTPNGVLATYCVKGTVRRNLAAAGFNVIKAPGPPGKREILTATPTTAHNR